MAVTPDTTAPTGASFALTGLRQEGGLLVVEGRWSGVRGLRFVRPALVLGDRELLATLEHKPWSPTADPWRAAFPWDGGELDPAEAALAVAPSVVVPLAPGDDVPEGSAPPAAGRFVRSVPAPADAATRAVPEPEPEPVPEPEPEPDAAAEPAGSVVLQPEPQEALFDAPPEQPGPEPAAPEPEPVAAAPEPTPPAPAPAPARPSIELERAEADARRERTAAQRDRERLAEQLEEAVRDRDAALRTRARMADERDAALEARDGLQAERDAALDQAARFRAQRDEALVAHRTLQRRVDGLLARDGEAPAPPATEDPLPVEALTGADEPIGVRAVPAAASLAPDLHRAERARLPRGASQFDLWAMRILGTITALCFIALLVLLLAVFV